MKKYKWYLLALVVLLIIIIFLILKVSNNSKNDTKATEIKIVENYNNPLAGKRTYDKAYVVIKENKRILHYSSSDSDIYGDDTIINVKDISDEDIDKIIKLLDKGNSTNKYTSSDTYTTYNIEYGDKNVYVDSKDDKENVILGLFEE